jgi:excisionase family DNA binding protein
MNTSDTITQPLTLSINEVARQLGVSRFLVVRAIRAGSLHARKMGARVLITKESLERFLAGGAS